MKFARLLIGISLIATATHGAWAQNNTSEFSQTGVGNTANVDNTAPGNVGNASTVVQNGTVNTATVFQRNSFNLSYIQQAGNSNEAVHQQSGVSNSADSRQIGDFLKSLAAQVGTSNKAQVLQSGATNISTVRQGFAVTASAPEGEFRPAASNTATVDQNGYGLASEIGQRGATTTAPSADQNTAFVYQRSSLVTTSMVQTSRVVQESRGNNAEVFQYVGAPDAVISSTITQRNSAATVDTGLSSNSASVAQEGLGHLSTVAQDGFRNSATVRMQGGSGISSDTNQSTITQTGDDLVATVRVRPLISGGAVRTRAQIAQTGKNHRTDIYQFGVNDQVAVTQSDGINTAGYASGETPRAEIFASQNARDSSASVTQNGDNYADVTQAFGSGSALGINQVDAGDIGGARSRNSAIVTQYGTANSTTIGQNAIGAAATTWQQLGTSENVLTLGQGTGGTALASTTGTAGFAAGPQGAGSSNLVADLIQGGARNVATAYQDGAGLNASIKQYGVGTNAYQNVVFVSQTGTSNSVIAFQHTGVGPSSAGDAPSGNSSSQNGGAAADEFYFAGGARSAEIRILQTSANNRASVYQYGRGQFARIEQSGNSNTAGIRQQAGATNATAVIRQSGDSNIYYIDQVTAGQYVSVIQTGNSNVAGNVQRGAGGSAGFAPPPGFPGG